MTSATGIVKVNPAVVIAKEAMNSILRFATEFGMTPAARARMQVHAPRPTGSDGSAIDGGDEADQAPFVDEFSKYH